MQIKFTVNMLWMVRVIIIHNEADAASLGFLKIIPSYAKLESELLEVSFN